MGPWEVWQLSCQGHVPLVCATSLSERRGVECPHPRLLDATIHFHTSLYTRTLALMPSTTTQPTKYVGTARRGAVQRQKADRKQSRINSWALTDAILDNPRFDASELIGRTTEGKRAVPGKLTAYERPLKRKFQRELTTYTRPFMRRFQRELEATATRPQHGMYKLCEDIRAIIVDIVSVSANIPGTFSTRGYEVLAL
jgi:hypothetical protein